MEENQVGEDRLWRWLLQPNPHRRTTPTPLPYTPLYLDTIL